MSTMRRGTTVIVINGKDAGVIGRVTGYDNEYNIEVPAPFGSWRLVRAGADEIVKAPHPFSWYDRVQSGAHFCEGCQDVESAMMAAR